MQENSEMLASDIKKRHFYSGKKCGVGFKASRCPLLSKHEIDESEWASNFYPAAFEIEGLIYRTSEHYFQSMRFRRGPSDEPLEIRLLRNEFSNIIRSSKTPNSAYKLAQYVSFTKKDGKPYVKIAFPSQNWIRDVIMDFYEKGLRKFEVNQSNDFEIMLAANRVKFGQNPILKAKLIETGTDELTEHTTRDNVWGDGGDGSGKNLLGSVLMQIRGEVST